MAGEETRGVRDGASCPGCGLPNYAGLCPVCAGDESRARDEGLPFPWADESEESETTR